MTRSSHTRAIYRTHWPPRWPLRLPTDWLPLAAGLPRRHAQLAAADTGLWTAIFRDNRGPLLKALGTVQECLDAFKYALMTDDEDAIRRWWDHAKERRDLFNRQLAKPGPTADPTPHTT